LYKGKIAMPAQLNMTIAESAVKRLAAMREKEGNPKLMLRVTVLGGGCSGFQYELELSDASEADDVSFANTVVTDPSSLEFLNGSEIYYEQNLMGAAFKIKNPNAASGCGCGKSFSVKM
jgi:iron-sulfur cluster insertion protein